MHHVSMKVKLRYYVTILDQYYLTITLPVDNVLRYPPISHEPPEIPFYQEAPPSG